MLPAFRRLVKLETLAFLAVVGFQPAEEFCASVLQQGGAITFGPVVDALTPDQTPVASLDQAANFGWKVGFSVEVGR